MKYCSSNAVLEVSRRKDLPTIMPFSSRVYWISTSPFLMSHYWNLLSSSRSRLMNSFGTLHLTVVTITVKVVLQSL